MTVPQRCFLQQTLLYSAKKWSNFFETIVDMTSARYVMARTTTDSVPEIHHVISGKVQISLWFQISLSKHWFLTHAISRQLLLPGWNERVLPMVSFTTESKSSKYFMVRVMSVNASTILKRMVTHVQFVNAWST